MLLLIILASQGWEIPHTMKSTLWFGWSRVGPFARSRGQIPCTIKYHGSKTLDHPINTLWRSPQKHFSTFLVTFLNCLIILLDWRHFSPFNIVSIFRPYHSHGVCWACSIPTWIHSPFLTTISGDDWRTIPWSRWTIFSNGCSGPCYWNVWLLLFFIS